MTAFRLLWMQRGIFIRFRAFVVGWMKFLNVCLNLFNMSIHFVTGKPGAGKGVVTMKEIIDELVNGERPIITNFAIRVDPWVRVMRKRGKTTMKAEKGLRAYLFEKYGKDFNVGERIFVLDDSQIGQFYLHRRNGDGTVHTVPPPDDSGQYDTSLALSNGGVFYVVDEAWKFYGARDWQKTSKGVLFYAAQHRKMQDTLLICCQHTKQVETQLRQVAQDFWVIKNHGKMKIAAFRQPAVFSVSVFDQPPTGGVQSEPMSRSVFKLDKEGLGSCFDTAAGVGLTGGGSADLGERAKGIPFWGVFIALALLCAVIISVAKGGGWLSGNLLTNGFKKDSKFSQAVSNQVTRSVASATTNNFITGTNLLHHRNISNPPPVPEVLRNAGTNRIFVSATTWDFKTKSPVVYLSDGSVVRAPSGRLTYVGSDEAIIDGVRIPRASSPVSQDVKLFLPGENQGKFKVSEGEYKQKFNLSPEDMRSLGLSGPGSDSQQQTINTKIGPSYTP